MRFVIVLVLFAACVEHGESPPPSQPQPPKPPARCGCTTGTPIGSVDDCCDSVTCFFDEETEEWQVIFCDPPPPDPCDRCAIGAGEICVQRFDGTCGMSTTCEVETVECPDNACSAECEAAYCAAPLQCETRPPCGTESPVAFTCYGP